MNILLNNKLVSPYILHVGRYNTYWLKELDLIQPKINKDISVISINNYTQTPLLFQQNIDIINPKDDFTKITDKIDCFAATLATITTEYCLLLDSVDSLILKDIDETFIENFKSLNCDIIFGWDINIHPHFILKKDEITKHLCGGLVFGKTSKLLELYQTCSTIKKELYNPKSFIDHETSEQFWLRLIINFYNKDIICKIDNDMICFGSIRGYNKHEGDTYFCEIRPDMERLISNDILHKYI